jgi:hypothetical protein
MFRWCVDVIENIIKSSFDELILILMIGLSVIFVVH